MGDIGDFAKFSMLQSVSEERSLGVAWYRYPDENHNADGKHVAYLDAPETWRDRSPQVFDVLGEMVKRNERSLAMVERSRLFPDATFSNQILETTEVSSLKRQEWRRNWFRTVSDDLSSCDIVFADPDNGLRSDRKFRFGAKKQWKSIPVSEARVLATDRPAIIYHHNSRFKGGHEAEIGHWQEALDCDFAIRVRYSNVRTYFFLNADAALKERARSWVVNFGRGSEKVVVHEP
ncbi:hypothetical protein [Celeribacter arenosi]|uniref:hypothetical protein n=1 Tax=Celeribacter arenosi TaxID=792649 RepID=UPI0031CE5F21